MGVSPSRGTMNSSQGVTSISTPRLTWKEHPAICYLRVLKLRETALLTFIGICTALVAGGGNPPLGLFLLTTLTIMIGSGGANGLTNYLDRHVDGRMKRTQRRMLPAGLIKPRRALLWALSLVVVALCMAFFLHLYAFLAALTGVIAAVVARKTWATHFLGSVSSVGPILVAWFAINPVIDATVILLTLIIMLWVPVHVWNLMIAYRNDYLSAGVNMFPLDKSMRLTSQISMVLSSIIVGLSFALWALGGFGLLYLTIAGIVGVLMLYGSYRIFREDSGAASLRLFRLSAYPFLGLTFIGLVADTWVRMLL